MASRDNEALTAARPAIGPVIQSLGLRLKRAFTNPIPTPPPAETISESELSRVIFIAAGAESRVHHGTDYRNTSERIMADLNAAKAELENAVQKFKPQFSTNRGVQNEQDIAFFTLARINSKLGNYDEAERIYKTLCPPISSCAPVSQRTVHTTGDTQAHEMEIMLAYLVFLANTARHLEFAESLGDHLLSTKTYWSAEDKCRVRLALVEIYNTQSNFALASERLRLIEALNPPVLFHIQISVSFYLNRAVSLAGLGQQSSSRQNFVTALVRSAVVLGMWHSTTLSVLYSYGKALKKWGAYEAAASLLGECCLGNYHRCGTLHPLSKRSYTELESKQAYLSIFLATPAPSPAMLRLCKHSWAP
ncbi:hypothetical protein K505DRAFT_324009 [Melanomma pulvis-pyrius CBS 109.77]|uniref:TPR-like protein n=1 Tax=Melanomma pulvis-pyrius CBS 109.77 TaxID=1314802 RepID=A0A6A6XGF8_9PLEO|nr:hypothetical protein K505DRAFT_324009 [Melanomma pulvis-pyrius CBS 109.77]